MRHLLALVLPVALLAACDRGTSIPGSPSDTGLAVARSSRAKDSLIVLKDSLLADRARQLSLQSQIIGDYLLSNLANSTARMIGPGLGKFAPARYRSRLKKSFHSMYTGIRMI